MSEVPRALMVSSNDQIRKELADTLRTHGWQALLSSRVVQGLCALSPSVSIVFCEDQLIDGGYLDFVDGARRIAREIPVVVVSQTFHVEEHQRALTSGVFDYLGWPLRGSAVVWALSCAFNNRDCVHPESRLV